jgi:hypothetical protein
VVVEHPRAVDQELREPQRTARIAGEQHALGEIRRRPQVDWRLGHASHDMEHCALPMANRRTTPKELPDAVREAVDRTVQATRGSAVQTRDRAQGAVDDLVDTVDDLVKGAEGQIVRGRRAAARAIDDVRPVTNDDLRELRAELRKISRRLDSIEERLPAKKAPAKRKRTPAKQKK